GAEGKAILKLFILEGILLGVIGGFIGVIIGAGIAFGINHANLVMPPPPGSSQEFILQLRLYPTSFLIGFAVAVCSSFVASIYPALKAAKLRVVDALRHV
ncbi:MAG TPA: FtsX-like permease family protein, partial [Turneriella sp.]|nr:FtsX-like permease family protein [Turneriella sp.]